MLFAKLNCFEIGFWGQMDKQGRLSLPKIFAVFQQGSQSLRRGDPRLDWELSGAHNILFGKKCKLAHLVICCWKIFCQKQTEPKWLHTVWAGSFLFYLCGYCLDVSVLTLKFAVSQNTIEKLSSAVSVEKQQDHLCLCAVQHFHIQTTSLQNTTCRDLQKKSAFILLECLHSSSRESGWQTPCLQILVHISKLYTWVTGCLHLYRWILCL